MKLLRILLLSCFIAFLSGQKYEDTHSLFKTLFNSSLYSPEVIPVSNQSEAIRVSVSFYLVSIVAVDDTTESFICNGFMYFSWTDQELQWNPEDYGNQTVILPLPEKIWRPRVILVNTLNERDPFGNDISPLFVYNTGVVTWSPGGLFTVSCPLNLRKYPFDEQVCILDMYPMGLSYNQLIFTEGFADVGLTFYSVNGEWDLLLGNLNVLPPVPTGIDFNVSTFKVKIHIRRRPTFYVLNVILPFVFLSFLNLLVFTIPQESGEKIGFGITVLMTLSVFFSIIGGILPRSSRIVPNIIIYLFTLYFISSLTVIDSIIIVFIYRWEERKEQHEKLKAKLKRIVMKIQRPKGKIIDVQPNQDGPESDKTVGKERKDSLISPSRDVRDGPEKDEEQNQDCFNNKSLAYSLDFYSGFIFLALWLSVTLWYFLSVLPE